MEVKSDIEIAQEAELKPITEVAELLDMTMDDLDEELENFRQLKKAEKLV